MDNLISVIIPIYNAEKYVDRCIESVCKQTYKNLEIILVDDGSPDSCPQICDKWAEKDNRIIVIHKQNGGVSTARNAGLDIARGDYIGFVDGDDYLEPEFYETMLNALLSNDVDIVSCGTHIENSQIKGEKIAYDCEKKLSKRQATEEIIESITTLPLSMCNKIYKRSVVIGARLHEDIRFAEDFLYNYEVAKNVENYLEIDYLGYHYYFAENSAVQAKFNVKKLDFNIVMEIIYKEIESDSTLLSKWVKAYVNKNMMFLKEMAISKSGTEYYDIVRNNVVKFKREVLTGKIFSKAMKLKMILICYCPRLYMSISVVRKDIKRRNSKLKSKTNV